MAARVPIGGHKVSEDGRRRPTERLLGPVAPRAHARRWRGGAVIAVAASLCAAGCDEGDGSVYYPPYHWQAVGQLDGPGQALAEADDRLYAASAGQLSRSDDGGSSWTALTAQGLPRGWVNALAALPSDPVVLAAYVWGKGLFRSADGGQSFEPLETLSPHDILAAFIQPRAKLVPFELAVDAQRPDRVLLAAPGALCRSADAGLSWEQEDASAADEPGRFNLLFTGAEARGSSLYAVSQSPGSILPPQYTSLVAGGAYLSGDDGATWRNATADLSAQALSGVTVGSDGLVYVSAMDGGLFRRGTDGRWAALGGPADAVAVSSFSGGLSVASGTRGLWRYEPSGWSQAGEGAVAALGPRYALMQDGEVYALQRGQGEPPPAPAGGTVYLALSFHTSLYHSYRGDTPDDDGYGLDIDVVRNTLEWLGEYPAVSADWDMDSYFTLDGWLASDAPDIIDGIAARVAEGIDGVRIMSWNNGAVASQPYAEFEQSVVRGVDSLTAAFGEVDPGVQPQECMFSPDHVGWYRELGIEWITLFNSMSPFTGAPLDEALEGAALYNPVTLQDGDDEMVLVPAYHHADVLDHGGLRGWVQQIADTIPGDTLLLVHFDADSESWLGFDGELAAIADLPFVRYTTVQDYLDAHEPVAAIELYGDQADGVGDGFQSWAEKDINHEIATAVARAREKAAWAEALAAEDATVEGLLEQALETRLLTLSTTHFGLASPYLHPDRASAARSWAQQAEQEADAALAAAEALEPVAAGSIELVHARSSAGSALVEIPVEVAAADYDGPDGLVIAEDGSELPLCVDVVDPGGDPVTLMASVVLSFAAGEHKELTWSYDLAVPYAATGGIAAGDLDATLPLALPFTECDGVRSDATLDQEGAAEVDARSVRARKRLGYALGFCDGAGTLEHTVARYDGLDATVIAVRAQMGEASEPELAESVALSPLSCAGEVDTITWRSFGGTIRTRPARRGQESWNGQSADGWVAYGCADGTTIAIAHRVTERTSLAFSPLRNDGNQALFAPLGTLWGDSPWHDGRRIGGLGLGDVVAGIIAPQFNPAAPDWSERQVRYRLLVGDEVDEGMLDLFAHPPLVRAGE